MAVVLMLAGLGCASEQRRPSVGETQARFAQEDHDEACAAGDVPDEECTDFKQRQEDRRQAMARAAGLKAMADALNPPKLTCVSHPGYGGTTVTECR